jgi:peptidoglycan/xylan/chitin deacetylase (PgdA/CDA1 family)
VREVANAIPVLLYHSVTTAPGDLIADFSTSPDMFRRHLDVIVEEGHRFLTFAGLFQALGSGQLPEKTVLLTFDDGYADFADVALPAIRERGLGATLFLTTGFLRDGPPDLRTAGPSDPMLSWAQLGELAAAGVEIGAHSHSHPQMDTCAGPRLREECVRPKALLEKALQQPVDFFAYPHGYNGPRVRTAVRRAGYTGAAGVGNALARADNDRWNVARLMVRREHGPETVRAWLRGDAVSLARLGNFAVTPGWRLFRRARAVVTRQVGSDYT